MERTWLNDRQIARNESVELWRYSGDWQRLPTEVQEERAGFVSYRATSPGLSEFAIVAVAVNVANDIPAPQDYLGQGSANLTAPQELREQQSANVSLAVQLDNRLAANDVKIVVGNLVASQVVAAPVPAGNPPANTHIFESVPVFAQMSAKLDSQGFQFSERDWIERTLLDGRALWSWNISPVPGSQGPQTLSIQIMANNALLAIVSTTVQVLPPAALEPTAIKPPPSPTASPAPTPAAESTATPTPPPPVVRYKLDTEVEPTNLGSVSVRPSSEDGTYTVGRDVVLTAQCSTAFGIWEGSIPEGTSRSSRTITVPMDRDRVLVAICLAPTPTPTPTPTAHPSRRRPRYRPPQSRRAPDSTCT